jgi:hypothetical protein
MKRLGHHRGCGKGAVRDLLQNSAASIVFVILRIEERDQRACIDEGHFRSFLRMAIATPGRVSVDVTLAYPPGPRSRPLVQVIGAMPRRFPHLLFKRSERLLQHFGIGNPVTSRIFRSVASASSSSLTVRIAMLSSYYLLYYRLTRRVKRRWPTVGFWGLPPLLA